MNERNKEELAAQHAERMRQLDAEGIAALFEAAGDYHRKHNKGPGGAAVCVCGAACGGSKACRGLAVLRDLFRYADFDDIKWREQFATLQRSMARR